MNPTETLDQVKADIRADIHARIKNYTLNPKELSMWNIDSVLRSRLDAAYLREVEPSMYDAMHAMNKKYTARCIKIEDLEQQIADLRKTLPKLRKIRDRETQSIIKKHEKVYEEVLETLKEEYTKKQRMSED
jgi:hypothetical protein